MKGLFFKILILLVTVSFTQSVEVLDFRYPLSNEMSYNQALEITLIKAKEEALRKAGVGESIKSFTSVIEKSEGVEYSSTFFSDAFSTIQGYIESWEYLSEPTSIKLNDLTYIQLSIKAKVKKYKTKRDLKFVARVEGVKTIYESNDKDVWEKNIRIRVYPTKDAYLKVFYINEKEAKIMYPIEVNDQTQAVSLFRDTLIEAGSPFEINYISPYTDEEHERGMLIFVLTKEQYPYVYSEADESGYYTETDINRVFEWYMSIEPEKKYIDFKSFAIIK